MKWISMLTAALLICVVTVLPVRAQIALPRIIGDGMVLQRGDRIPIWGWTDCPDPVVVRFNEQVATAIPKVDGSWCVTLQAQQYGGPHQMTIEQGDAKTTLRDILIGEVWVCSGQSNMNMRVANTDATTEEIANLRHSNMRLFTVMQASNQRPQQDCAGGSWVSANPATVSDFSATAYYFGRILLEELQVPIGLIHSSWGGTLIESWMSRDALHAHPYFQYVFRAPYGNQLRNEPAGLFNAMIHPLIPYGIQGVIWYQGEDNGPRAYLYRELLPTLIKDWRAAWGQGDFPFLLVQLPGFRTQRVTPVEKTSTWAYLREAQLMTLKSVPNTGMAICVDIGDAIDIHPKNKRDVGYRLALAALRTAYGEDIVDSGPVYQRMAVEGDQIRLYFGNTGSGLVTDGESLTGFAVAGPDERFVYADAKIEDDTVVLSSKKVQQPVAVRYGWADNPICNLFNKEGLPASPFRTDDWLDEPAKLLQNDLHGFLVSVHSPQWKQEYNCEIPLDIRVAPGKELVSVTIQLDGRTVHCGTTLPQDITINRGELTDGPHSLHVCAKDTHDLTDRIVVPFTIANTEIGIPGSVLGRSSQVKGTLPVQIRTQLPESAIEEVTLRLIPVKDGTSVLSEARVISSSVHVPGRMELVSTDFPDGAYELVANVNTTAGVGSSATRTIVIKNWQELVDEFEPPKKTSWFGTVDMSKTCETSPGWKYDAEALFDDNDRRHPMGNATEYLVWHSPGLRYFELTVYSCAKDFADSIILSLSRDGKMWQDISYLVRLEGTNAEGWSKVLLTGWVDDEDINYLRVTLAEGDREPGDIQLGRLVLRLRTP